MNLGHFLNEEQLKAYLYYGYVPQPKEVNVERLLERYNINLKEDKTQEDLETLIEKGSKILDNIFKDIADKVGDKKVIIPLSGGMDSRTILGGLLKYLPRKQIQTITLGVPGTRDYEIGQLIAKKTNVSNKSINLNNIGWNEKELIKYAKDFQHPIAFIEGFLFNHIFYNYRNHYVFISGFLGEALSGAHLPVNESKTLNQAIQYFSQKNKYSKFSFKTDQITSLLFKRLLASNLISYDDQCDFFIRQRFFIKPIILPKGINQIIPFLYSSWIEFMLNLPNIYRNKQFLYKKILLSSYPELFSLPLKNTGGVPLNASNLEFNFKRIENKLKSLGRKNAPFIFRNPAPHINYIDFEQAYRKKEDLKFLAEKSLNDLTNREVINHIVDIKKVWEEHQSGKFNHSQLISLLVSLEIFFKTKEIKINEKQY